jgi:lysozyme family protein
LLSKEYNDLFDKCEIRGDRKRLVAQAAARITAHAAVYRDAAEAAGGKIPWYFIGILHALESSFSFSTHLHNGDPLTARTVREPKGHPRAGAPPFTWKESALDALRLKGIDRATEWSLPRILHRFEAYNGFGYRKYGIHSPYLWSFSQHYTRGKFVRDHVFDPEAVSEQCGAAVLLKQLVLDGVVTLNDGDRTLQAEAALGLRATGLPAPASLPWRHARKELEFPGEVKEGARGPAAKRVQEWCSFHGFPTRIDGHFGPATADALRDFQDSRGLPVTGVADAASWAALTAPMLHAIATPAPMPAGLHAMVLSVAHQHLAQKPIEIGGDNCGPWVRLYMEGQDGPGQLWCAGFVCFVLEQAARALNGPMPIRRKVGVDELVFDAKRAGRFLDGDAQDTPAARTSRLPAGSLFVIRHQSNPNDWTHTGFVIEPREHSFLTIEGNTNRDGGANGFEVASRTRGYGRADFVLIA